MIFGIPPQIFWPTIAFGTIILVIVGGVALLRLLPQSKSRTLDQPHREALSNVQTGLDRVEQLQERVSGLEERVDFTERLLAKLHDAQRWAPPTPRPQATVRSRLRRSRCSAPGLRSRAPAAIEP
jgi:hypothetical protein